MTIPFRKLYPFAHVASVPVIASQQAGNPG
jgi:hypothetical protein